MVVFVGLIKEKVNIVEILEIIEKFWMFAGEPVMFAAEATLEMRRFAVKIVIAWDDEYGGDFGELVKPGKQTFALGFDPDLFLAVDEVTGNANIVGLALLGGIDDGAQGEIFDKIAVVEVGNQEKFGRTL